MITREKLSFMTETIAVTVDFQNSAEQKPEETSWSVLCGKVDPWIVEQAENVGAQCITGIRVDKLIEWDGKVVWPAGGL